MTYILDTVKELPEVFLRPSRFFAKRKPEELYMHALVSLATFLGLATLIVFLAAAMNAGELKQSVEAAYSTLPKQMRESFIGRMNFLVPWNRLLFPVVFLVYVPMVGLFRQGVLKLLGDNRRPLSDMQSITAYAVLPVVIISALSGALNNLFPQVQQPGQLAAPGFAGILAGLLSLGAGAAELVVFVRTCRVVYEQNLGRAGITWFLPWVGLFLFTMIVAIVVSLVAFARR